MNFTSDDDRDFYNITIEILDKYTLWYGNSANWTKEIYKQYTDDVHKAIEAYKLDKFMTKN